MTLLRKGRDPRPIVDTCTVCDALNEYEIEDGNIDCKFWCGHCGHSVSYFLAYFYKDAEATDESLETSWTEQAAHALKKERSDEQA